MHPAEPVGQHHCTYVPVLRDKNLVPWRDPRRHYLAPQARLRPAMPPVASAAVAVDALAHAFAAAECGCSMLHAERILSTAACSPEGRRAWSREQEALWQHPVGPLGVR